MLYFSERPLVLFGLPFLIVLNGCNSPPPECDTPEIRGAVLKTFSEEPGNRLAAYAANRPPVNTDSASNVSSEGAPVWVLGEQIVMTSASADKQTFQCSSDVSVTVNGTTASKEVDFSVRKASDGKISVSVAPFQF